jgi:hypothetical protein
MKAWHSPRLWLPATNHLRDCVEISAIIFEPSRQSFQSNRFVKHKLDGRDARLAGAVSMSNLGQKSSCLPNALPLLIQSLSKPIATKLRRLRSIGSSG